MLTLVSTAFAHEGVIPKRHTCDGDNSCPPLSFTGVPKGAVSLALIADDPDVPKEVKPDGVFDHLVLFNMPPSVEGIPEGAEDMLGTFGSNGAGQRAYTGPCPPTQYEPREHRYFFRLYALDTELSLPPGASKDEVLGAMEGHVLEQAELMGRYERSA